MHVRISASTCASQLACARLSLHMRVSACTGDWVGAGGRRGGVPWAAQRAPWGRNTGVQTCPGSRNRGVRGKKCVLEKLLVPRLVCSACICVGVGAVPLPGVLCVLSSYIYVITHKGWFLNVGLPCAVALLIYSSSVRRRSVGTPDRRLQDRRCSSPLDFRACCC